MVKLDGLSNDALGILVRLLSDDEPVTDWVLQNLVQERDARAAGGHAFPLEIPVMSLEDARILNRHLIVAAHTLEDLVYQPHGDNAPDAPFLEGARFLAQVSEDLGKHALAGAGTLQ
jgi:hypothetical protein